MTPEQQRQQILNKVNHYLSVVEEHVQKYQKTRPGNELAGFISSLNSLVELMMKAKNDKSFIQASQQVGNVIQEGIFNPLYAPKEPPAASAAVSDKTEEPETQEEDTPEVHIHVSDDIKDAPEDIRKHLAEMLKGLGLPEDEINKKLF